MDSHADTCATPCGKDRKGNPMNIIVRNMIASDIGDLPVALARQGWALAPSLFERLYGRMARKLCDIIVAEVAGEPAGFTRLEWVETGENCFRPEVCEFVVLERFAGTGVAESMNAEAERRVAFRTGETAENALMAVYGSPSIDPPVRSSYVLDGLYINHEGRFVRGRAAGRPGRSGLVCLRLHH